MSYRPIAETYPYLDVTFGNEMPGRIHVDRIDVYGQSPTGYARVVSNGYHIDLNDRFTDFEPRLREAIEYGRPKALSSTLSLAEQAELGSTGAEGGTARRQTPPKK